jgi:mono/diheme cytochrome c family protein
VSGRASARWVAIGLAVLAASGPGLGVAQPQSGAGAGFEITPVEGPSWLKHLGLSRQKTAMGQMSSTGGRRSAAGSPAWGLSSFPETLTQPFTVTGADLYRIDCQSCHGIGGAGAPPEIRSLLDAVRATSPVLARAQLAKRGVELDPKSIRQMTSQAEASLLERLSKGGQKMPPFRHLRGSEVRALLAYLRTLAGVPGASDRQVQLTEPAARVGEHLVKGTCFICHDATGPGRDAMTASSGVIPSLASFLDQEPVNVVVHKVLEGAPAPSMLGLHGEMPVFSYLTAEEVSAAYIYLMTYPPHP